MKHFQLIVPELNRIHAKKTSPHSWSNTLTKESHFTLSYKLHFEKFCS